MICIVFDQRGAEIARLDGRVSLADLPVASDGLRIGHIVTSGDVRAEAAEELAKVADRMAFMFGGS